MKYKIEHYYIALGGLAIFLPQLVEGWAKKFESVNQRRQNDTTSAFTPAHVIARNYKIQLENVETIGEKNNTKSKTKTIPQWLTPFSPEDLADTEKLSDEISEHHTSPLSCQPEDYTLLFNVTELHEKNATFTWRLPKCIQDELSVEYYDIVLTEPDKNEFRFRFGNNITRATISNGGENLVTASGTFVFLPCGEYKAVLYAKTNETHTFLQSNTVSIVLPLESIGTDTEAESLSIVEKGAHWILFRWKASQCLSDNSDPVKCFARANVTSGCTISFPLNSRDLSVTETGVYYPYNLTQCPTESTLTPCTTYKIWLGSKSTKSGKQSKSLFVTTLPPNINLNIEAPTSYSLKLLWQVSPHCKDYHLLKYSLHVKANSHTVPEVPIHIDANCTDFTLGRDTSKCGIAYTLLPCTQYDFELTPVYENYPDPVAPTTITYTIPFPSKGDYFGIIVGKLSRALQPKLDFTLHPQCLPSIDGLKVTLSYGTSSTSVSVSKDCLMKLYMNGTTTIHLGNLECFPNIDIFKICATRYFVSARPILAQNSSEALGEPEEIATEVLIADDWINIPKVSIQARGADWIFAAWEPPACSIDMLPFKGYELALYEKDISNEPCFVTSLFQTSLNLSHVISCKNRRETIEIQSCTVYYVEVKPHFGIADLDSNANWIRSNNTLTLAKMSSLVLLEANARSLSVSWGDAAQNVRCVSRYELRLRDEFMKIKYSWVSNHDSAYTFTNLTPCTMYEVQVKGIPEKGNEIIGTIEKYETLELGPEIPLKLNYSYWNDTAVDLTWDLPQDYAKCVHGYRIQISQINTNGLKICIGNRTTKLTKLDFCCLDYDTVYEVNVTACTLNYSCQTMPANIFINGRTGKVRPAATVAMIILFSICTVFLILLAYWCYVTQRWRTCLAFCFDTKGESNRRRRPCYSRANQDDIEEIGARKKSRGSNRQSLKHSLRSYVTSRPVGIQDFEKALAVLMADTCALLGEEYEDIKVLSNENQPKTQAAKQENKAKNRYVNILPYDHSRVPLSSSHEEGTEDYINASYIQGFNGAREYIAAQGPKPATISDFWRMIWEQDVRVLVMVTQLEEHGRIKCAQYWPEGSQVLMYGAIAISQVLQVEMNDYVIRELEVQNDGSKRIVKHMHFLKWPDFGCPENPETLLSFVDAVRDRVLSLSAGGPILVHCSAGVGRTGTFIAVDWLVQEAQVSREIDIFNTVLKLRSDRMNMVQTEDQYLFIYQCLAHFIKTRLREGHPLPLNVDEDREATAETIDRQSRPPSGIVRQVSEVETNM